MAYEKQTWTTGEVITQEKLNHMEDGIENAYEIPAVTETDNGKVLGVEDGAWSVIDGGGLENLIDGSAEGSVRGTNASSTIGINSFAFGVYSRANGDGSHAEGSYTTASGFHSHAEGSDTTAAGQHSHAEGHSTRADGSASHAEGNGTLASGENQHVEGKFNIEDTQNIYAHIIGNGTGAARSNAFAIKWDGTLVFADGTEITPAQFAQLKALLNQ